eukprot:g19610.t1
MSGLDYVALESVKSSYLPTLLRLHRDAFALFISMLATTFAIGLFSTTSPTSPHAASPSSSQPLGLFWPRQPGLMQILPKYPGGRAVQSLAQTRPDRRDTPFVFVWEDATGEQPRQGVEITAPLGSGRATRQSDQSGLTRAYLPGARLVAFERECSREMHLELTSDPQQGVAGRLVPTPANGATLPELAQAPAAAHVLAERLQRRVVRVLLQDGKHADAVVYCHLAPDHEHEDRQALRVRSGQRGPILEKQLVSDTKLELRSISGGRAVGDGRRQALEENGPLAPRRYWLMKSEPLPRLVEGVDVSYSFSRLLEEGSTLWDGVRNHQAKKLLRDEIKTGDWVLFYHSSCKEPSVVGLAQVLRHGLVDQAGLDPQSPYYDPKHTAEHPRWFSVEVGPLQAHGRNEAISEIPVLARHVSLKEIKADPQLKVLSHGHNLKELSHSLTKIRELPRTEIFASLRTGPLVLYYRIMIRFGQEAGEKQCIDIRTNPQNFDSVSSGRG